jgi:integral membrane sensor domain MASE1
MEENIDQKIIGSLDNLSENLSKYNSLKKNLLRGIFFGVGSAIGASIIAAIIIAALNYFIGSVNDVPLLDSLQQEIERQR